MYFLVEKRSGQSKIVSNFEKNGLKMAMLLNYLRQNDIKFLESKEEMPDVGKYCVPEGFNKYRVYVMKRGEDGYLFSGIVYEEYQYTLSIVYYKINENKIINIIDEIDSEPDGPLFVKD